MRERIRHWFRLALSLGAVAAAAFAILELVLRLSVGDAYATLYRPDPQTLYRLSPGSEKVFQHPAAHGGARIPVQVNEDGYRGDELLPRGAARRVAVYGDSFIAAEFSPLANTFTEQLEIRLEEQLGEPVEVVNAGVPGYGPDQVLVKLRAELPRLRPEAVILAIYAGNDFGDLIRNKLFSLTEDGQLVEMGGRVVGRTATRLQWSRFAPVLVKVIARAHYNWTHRAPADATPSDARERQIDEWLAQRDAEWTTRSELGVTNLLRDTPDVDLSTAPRSEPSQYKLRLMAALLAGIRAAASHAGVPLLLVIVPSPMDVCEGYPLAHVNPARFAEYRPERVTQILSQMARELGVSQLDLYPEFRRRDACDLFFPADPHWNDEGQELAAQLTASALSGEGLLARRAKPSPSTAPTPPHPIR